jgi:hypothetical protein
VLRIYDSEVLAFQMSHQQTNHLKLKPKRTNAKHSIRPHLEKNSTHR